MGLTLIERSITLALYLQLLEKEENRLQDCRLKQAVKYRLHQVISNMHCQGS